MFSLLRHATPLLRRYADAMMLMFAAAAMPLTRYDAALMLMLICLITMPAPLRCRYAIMLAIAHTLLLRR